MAVALGILGNSELMDISPFDRDTNIFFIFLTEMIFSWIFLTIYMYAKNDWVTPTMDFGLRAFTMMGVQYLCSSLSLKMTGGTVNPSIGPVAIIFRLMKPAPIFHTDSNAKYLFPYLLAPLVAAVLAGLYIKYFAIKVTPPQPEYAGSPYLQRASTKRRIQADTSDLNHQGGGSVIGASEGYERMVVTEVE